MKVSAAVRGAKSREVAGEISAQFAAAAAADVVGSARGKGAEEVHLHAAEQWHNSEEGGEAFTKMPNTGSPKREGRAFQGEKRERERR